MSKVALSGELALSSTGIAGHVHIQDEQVGRVLVASSLSMFSEDGIDGLLHLLDILFGTGVESFLHDGLLGTGFSSEGTLEARIVSDAFVDLGETVGSGEDGDESIQEFLHGRVLDDFLVDDDLLFDGSKELVLFEPFSDSGQEGVCGEVELSALLGRLFDGEEPPDLVFVSPTRAVLHRKSCQKRCRLCHSTSEKRVCSQFGQNLSI